MATADYSVPVETLYADDVRGPTLRTAAGWVAAQEYALPDPGRVATAIAIDARFGLQAAWVRAARGDISPIVEACSGNGVALRINAGATFEGAAVPGALVLIDPIGAGADATAITGTAMASGVPYHDAGASAADELGCVIATAIAYLRLDHAPVLRFGLGGELLVDIAKLRAARWLWRRITAHAGSSSPDAMVVASTGRRNRAKRGPWVNQLRGTVETLAAVVGGADEVITQPFSEPLGAPTAAARRWALGTQNLLREESHLGLVADPAAGAGTIEAFTRDLAEQAWGRVQEIERADGMANALASGLPQGWAAQTCAQRMQESRLVGATAFPSAHAHDVPVEVDEVDHVAAGCRLEEAT